MRARWIGFALSAIFLGYVLMSASYAEEVTPNSACGAAAVGMLKPKTMPVAKEAVPPGTRHAQRVNGSGIWVPCSMPPTCRERVLLVWHGDGKYASKWCAPLGKTLKPEWLGTKRTVIGHRNGGDRSDWTGAQTWECKADGWQLVSSYCR